MWWVFKCDKIDDGMKSDVIRSGVVVAVVGPRLVLIAGVVVGLNFFLFFSQLLGVVCIVLIVGLICVYVLFW